jgi:hypothetical protein
MLLLSRSLTSPGHSPIVGDDRKMTYICIREHTNQNYKKQKENDEMDFKINKEGCLFSLVRALEALVPSLWYYFRNISLSYVVSLI